MLAPCEALEVACGEGSDALHLAREGFDVLATEWAPAALEITRQRAADEGLTIRTRLVDATSMALGERFQFIYMGYIPLAPPSLEEALGRVKHHIGPGGTVLYLGLEETGSASEIVRYLEPLSVERCETLTRVISMPLEEDFEASCVLVRARRELH